MENENQIYVRYGDYIMLQIEHLQGTVQSSSFLNRNVYLQLHPNHFQELISRNKRDFIFQVLPKFSYDAQIDYQQALEFFNKNYNENQEEEENKDNEEKKEGKGEGEQKEEQEGQGEEQPEDEIMNVSVSSLLGIGPKKKKGKPLNFAQKKERDNYKKKLLQLQKKLKEEEIQNLKTQNNRRGEFIEYGNEIMLLHVDSNCFLEASKAAADEDNSCNRVELNQYGSKQVYWKTVGGFRYKQPGDRIHYNDQIVLQHIMTNAFLHVTEKCIKVEGLEGQVPEDIKLGQSLVTPKKIDRRHPPTSFAPLCEINVSTIKSKFSIIIYRYFDEDQFDQFVKGGSVIRMLHSEKGGYLHSDDKDFTDDGLAEVYIWNFKGKSNDIESTSSSSLFEIQLCCKNQKFIEEPQLSQDLQGEQQEKPKMNSNDRSGKVFEYSLTNAQAADTLRKQNPFEAQYRLRHLNTGRLVIDQEVEIQGMKMRTLGLGPHVIMKNLANFSEKLIEKLGPEIKEIETLDGYIIEDMQTDMSPKTMEELDIRSRFRIISTNPSLDPRINQFSCVQMQHVTSDMYLAYESKSMFAGVAEARKEEGNVMQSGEEMMKQLMEEEANNKKTQKIANDDDKSQKDEEILYFPVNDDDISSGTRDACELKAMRSNEDAFFVIPEKQSVLQDIFFVQTSIDVLKKYLPIICSRSLEISKEKQVRIFVMLETIHNFLVGDTAIGGEQQDLPLGFSKNENDLIQSLKEKSQLRQKLMRELYAVEHLVQIIYLPFAYGDFVLKQVKGHDLIAKVIRKVYTLVRLIGQCYYQNELYVSQWINIFFNHAMATNSSNNIGADDAILVLVDENKKLLDIQINQQIIERFIVLCKAQNRNKKIIQLLTAICAVAGEAIKKNQDDITAKLLEDESNRAVLMMPLRMRNDQSVDVLLDNSEPGGCWKSLNNYRTFPRETYGYFLSIVDLSSELCVGRNNRSLRSLQDMFSFDTIRNIVKNNNLPPEMRAIFMRILLNMHMDREPLEAIQIPSLTGIWSELAPFIQEKFNDATNLVYGVKQAKISVPQSLVQIKQYVEQCLYDTEGIMNIFEVGKNIMIFETLKIIRFMLNYGFYIDLKELKEISIPMIKILNGSTDIYYNQLENNGEIDEYLLVKRYFCTAEDLIIQCKIIICENLLTISMLETDGKAQVFMSKFKADIDLLLLRRKINVQVSTNAQKKQTIEEEQVFELPKQGIFSCFKSSEAEENETNASKQENNKNQQFMDLITSSHNFEAENQDSYICVLFDLLLYREPQLASKAFQLLYRLFCRKRILLENLMGIQMLENNRSTQVLKLIKKHYTDLKEKIDDVEQWLNKDNHRAKKIKYEVTQIFEFFSQICSEKKKNQNQNETKIEDQSIQKQNFSALEMENQESVLAVPNENTSKANITKGNVKNADKKVNKQDFILFNNQDQITNKENQRLISNYQIDTMAMFFIKFRVDRNIVNDPFYNNLIHQCYQFLVLYVKDNFANQIKVHSNLEIFLRDIDKNPLICLLLYEMFRDNKRFLTLNVTKILRMIISSAEEAPLSSSKKALYMKLLEVFCKFEDKLVRPNQQEIVVTFTRDIAKNNLIFLFTVEGLPHLQKMLRQCMPDEKPKRLYKAMVGPKSLGEEIKDESEQRAKITMEIFNIIVCLNLMSMCCEGKSDVAENRCQTEILNIPTALYLYKLAGKLWPFKCSIIRYVAQVFLDSNNVTLFQVGGGSQNLNSLIEMIELLREDMANIHQNWNENKNDMPLDMPDETSTTLNIESQNFALNYGVTFLKALLKNKRINLGEDLYGTLHDITSNVAKMYYQSHDEDSKINALDVLIFINSTENLAHLLENVQHPANQNIYLENKKAQMIRRICGVETENGEKTTALSAKLMQLAFSPNMVHQKEKEFENLCLWVTNINLRISSITSIKNKYEEDEQFSEKSFSNVSYKAILASFMSLLDSQSLSKDLHISGLRLLRKCVEAYNPGTTKPAADWQTQDWWDYQKIIEAKQNLLVEVGCVEFSCKHIQEVEDDDILEETFLVCMTLLLGGNRNAQDSFYKFFYFQDPTNLIMLKFKKLFIEYFDLTKKVLGEKNAKLVMMFRQQQRKDEKEAQLKALADQELGPLDDEAIFAIKGYTLEEVVAEADDVKQEEEEQEEDEDEQLLTVDESMEEGGGGQKDGGDTLDEMFMVRQTKTQTVIKCIRMLRFMQLLCEGQHLNLQNFLREQVFHSGASTQKSFNFITYVAQMLALYEKQYINCFSCSFGDQLISTLIETVQGPCKKNQMTLVEAKLVDCCRDLVQQGVSSKAELQMKGFSTPEKLKFHDSLISYAIKLMLSIIEGPVNSEIYKAIANSFDDFVILTKRMEIIYERFVSQDLGLDVASVSLQDIKSSLKRDSFAGGIVEGFDIYSLINQLSILLRDVEDKISQFSEGPSYSFFKKNTGNVEIQKEGEIMTIYFPIQPVTTFLTEGTKAKFQREVERESNQHKIIDLIAHIPKFIDELEHLYEQSHHKIQITPSRFNALKDISTILSLCLALLIIFFYRYDRIERADGTSDLIATIDPLPDQIIAYLGYSQLATSIFIFVGFVINRYNIIVRSGWRHLNEVNRELMKSDVKYVLYPLKPPYGDFKAKDLPVDACRILLLTEGPYHPTFVDSDGQVNLVYYSLDLEKRWICFCFLLQDFDMIFLMLYLCFSIQGIIQSRVYYSFHLLDCVNRFPQLQTVIQSVTVNGNQLMMTAMLGVLGVYIYSTVGFIFVSDTYYRDAIDQGLLDLQGDSICQSMLHCFLSTLLYGLRGGGGIADYLPTESLAPKNRSLFFFRACYDICFYISIITVLLNIIFGIIIDTFAQLRDKKCEMEEDMKNVCFICNIERQIFERDTEEGFEYHCLFDHDVWQYLNFIIHLKSINPTDLNGTESNILRLFEQDDISWFPMQKSQRLIMVKQRRDALRQAQQRDGDGDENQIDDPITAIKQYSLNLEDKLKQISKKMNQ